MPGLLSVRFPRPLAEPAVPVSGQRALHGSCRQASSGIVQGLGILAASVEVPGDRHYSMLNSSIPSAWGLVTGRWVRCGPADVFPRPAVEFHLPGITLCQAKFSRVPRVCLQTACRK